jgi:hypothetical protein
MKGLKYKIYININTGHFDNDSLTCNDCETSDTIRFAAAF